MPEMIFSFVSTFFLCSVGIGHFAIANEGRRSNVVDFRISSTFRVLLNPNMVMIKDKHDDTRSAEEELLRDPKVIAAYKSLASRSPSLFEQPIQNGVNEVCQSVQDDNYRPRLGINLNGTTVEIRQYPNEHQTFLAGYCAMEGSSCVGLKGNRIIKSACETRLRWHWAITRPFGFSGSWTSDQILVPYSCQCIYFAASRSTQESDLDWTFGD